MPEQPRLVVTADDLGMREEWDEAILDAVARGFVTSVSVVANGERYAQARALLRRTPELECGVHLNVFEGAPLAPPHEVSALLNGQGRFPGTVSRWLQTFVKGTLRVDAIAREWECQVRRLLDDGLQPAHLNSHFHLHMLPPLFDVVVALARRYSIRWIRITDESPWPALAVSPGRLSRFAKVAVLRRLAQQGRRRLREAGLPHEVGCRGVGPSEALGLREWRRLLAALPPQPVEIVCHPGQSPEQREALRSPSLLAAIRQRATLSSFRALESGGPSCAA